MSNGSGNSPNITIFYDNGNLQVTPSPYYAGAPTNPPQALTVIWGPASSVQSIDCVTITAKDGSPYSGSQPVAAGSSGNWQWTDQDAATSTYEYGVSAHVSGVGVVTLDPQIINQTDG